MATHSFLPEKPWMSLEGYCPWGEKWIQHDLVTKQQNIVRDRESIHDIKICTTCKYYIHNNRFNLSKRVISSVSASKNFRILLNLNG